jgi:hypothetical protein
MHKTHKITKLHQPQKHQKLYKTNKSNKTQPPCTAPPNWISSIFPTQTNSPPIPLIFPPSNQNPTTSPKITLSTIITILIMIILKRLVRCSERRLRKMRCSFRVWKKRGSRLEIGNRKSRVKRIWSKRYLISSRLCNINL